MAVKENLSVDIGLKRCKGEANVTSHLWFDLIYFPGRGNRWSCDHASQYVSALSFSKGGYTTSINNGCLPSARGNRLVYGLCKC